jgi:transposase
VRNQEIARLLRWRLRIVRQALESQDVAGTCRHFGICRQTYYRWYQRFLKFGEDGLKDRSRRPKSIGTLKADEESNINAVFEILHSPPSEHGINRTTWRILDIRTCLEARGLRVSKKTITKIVRNAGYSWKKARIALTSSDPNYRLKLDRIKKILSSLGTEERFFSIDEFGPLAIKMIGGRKLVAPGERILLPQFQRSRGTLLVTAALELSTNQITHLYSERKNTTEMIRLIDELLSSYRGCSRIYLSWDCASWHSSQKLKAKIAKINRSSYRNSHGTPRVKLVPLPASSQFLNVIESVFSGMAKAIIHNSNYASVEEAQAAVDQYFEERNRQFRDHPKVAGKKIWGKEPVPSGFSESQNCKDKHFR